MMALRGTDKITISQAEGIRNVFANDWKPNFYNDNKKKIASIPFMRNLIEYTRSENDPDYLTLTSALHWKENSDTLTVQILDEIFNGVFSQNGASTSPQNLYTSVLVSSANDCLDADFGMNFENKIVLSIAIRLLAEKFMISKIADADFLAETTSNQTAKLFGRFRKSFRNDAQVIEVLQRVVLMTPEAIHLNSFMYEPILDMSDDHLRQLYKNIAELPSA